MPFDRRNSSKISSFSSSRSSSSTKTFSASRDKRGHVLHRLSYPTLLGIPASRHVLHEPERAEAVLTCGGVTTPWSSARPNPGSLTADTDERVFAAYGFVGRGSLSQDERKTIGHQESCTLPDHAPAPSHFFCPRIWCFSTMDAPRGADDPTLPNSGRCAAEEAQASRPHPKTKTTAT